MRRNRERSRIRKWVLSGVALGLGGVLAAGLGEGLARVFYWSSGDAPGAARQTGRFSTYDATLGWRLLPGGHGRLSSGEYDTTIAINAQGLRQDRDVSYAKGPGRRVLILGDSFTFGYGVEANERYSERLEEQLDGVEVVNMGVPGTGTDQQLLLYQAEGARYDADLVILAYLVENIIRNGNAGRVGGGGTMVPKPRFVLNDGELELTNVPVPRKVVRDAPVALEWERRQSANVPLPFKQFLREHSALYQLVRDRLGPVLYTLLRVNAVPYPEYDASRSEWQITQALLAKLADEVRSGGSDFLLVIIPTREYVYRSYVSDAPHREIKAFAERAGIDVVDLLPALKEAARDEDAPLYYSADFHWTPRGHEVGARVLARSLRERGY